MSTTKNTLPHNGQEYWRSLEQLENAPEYREMLKREFPEEMADTPAGMNRRRFLTLMGASISLAGLQACRRPVEKIVPFVSIPEEMVLGNAQYYATTMPLGNEAFHLLVEAHEGRPTKIAGNKMNPMNGASTNPWTNASVLGLYDPDRSQHFLNKNKETSQDAFLANWMKLYAEFAANGGDGLAVLSESWSSPTMDRLAKDFRKTFPKAQFAVYDPVSDENIHQGLEIAGGNVSMPVYDFEKADIVLSLESDFLGNEFRQYANVRGFTKRRHVQTEHDGMNRLYLVESSLTQTSGMADHRLRLQSGLVGAFTAALAAELRTLGASIALDLGKYQHGSFNKKWIAAVARDLIKHKGKSIILAGRRQPAAVHALVFAMNEALGNNGQTVGYKAQPFSAFSSSKDAFALVQSMSGKKVKALAILGGNPAYSMPADLKFKDALANVGTSIHLSEYVNETSALATWHVPQLHYLESWGDASGIDGFVSVVQPLIAPLYGGKNAVEMLAILATGKDAKGFDLVQQTWKTILPGNFDTAWRKVLHDGVHAYAVPDAGLSLRAASVAEFLSKNPFSLTAARKDNLEVDFHSSYSLYDGRFSNNGWLQELPDPVTKITWDNCALISKKTAEDLGLKKDQTIRIQYKGNELVMPIWIMPGQADYCITVQLGYGKSSPGRVQGGVGCNTYKLRTAAAPYFDGGVRIDATGDCYKLACVQDNHGLDTEKLAADGIQERLPMIVREGTLEEYKKNPAWVKEVVEIPPLRSMWDEHKYDQGPQWGMSIDLNACIGCAACTIACQSENNIPIVGREQVLNGREMHWIRIDRYFKGSVEDPEVLPQPMACVQCEMAPCEQVCPVAATSHDNEGLNVMTYNRCIGTRYCSNNCPYKVRRFNFFNYTKDYPETLQMAQNPEVTVRFRGVMEKCTYCVQRISNGKIVAKREGRDVRDGDIQTACQESCPAQAIVFGNILDPDSAVAKAKKLNRDYAVLGELNIRPRTTYLAKLRNPNPDLGDPA